ncbi:unnamed protein product, partial [Chrysoparadoxa australica]
SLAELRPRKGTRCYYASTRRMNYSPHADQNSLAIHAQNAGVGKMIKPQRIVIVRHGESMGNLDETAYGTIPDWLIPLTKQGHEDARNTGRLVKQHVRDGPVFFYTSPYLRTKQTLAGMVEAFTSNEIIGVREEPRLTEQQFGNFQNLQTIQSSKAERARFGRFYYRFPEGESGLDVYNRATSFIATMFRDFANPLIARDDITVIIVTHGLTLRLLVMRWFRYSILEFESTFNPPNGGFVVMERRNNPEGEGEAWYELTKESLEMINLKPQSAEGLSLPKLLSQLPKVSKASLHYHLLHFSHFLFLLLQGGRGSPASDLHSSSIGWGTRRSAVMPR